MLATLVAFVVAAAPSVAPTVVVQSADKAIQKVLQGPSPTVENLANVADQYVDFGELAKRALGKDWDKLKPAQQKDFSDTMKGLLRANYAQKAIAEGRGGADVKYVTEEVKADEAVVTTAIKVKNDDLPVLYKLFNDGKGWRIYDVVTDDVSLVSTYSDQFRQMMSKKGFDGLLSSLKAKREQLEKKGTTVTKAPSASPRRSPSKR